MQQPVPAALIEQWASKACLRSSVSAKFIVALLYEGLHKVMPG